MVVVKYQRLKKNIKNITLGSGLFLGMVYHSEWKTGCQLGPMRHISTQNFLEHFPPGPAGIIRCVRFSFFAVSILTATRSLSYEHVCSFLFIFSP